MDEITVQKLFELYNDTLQMCGTYLLEEDEGIIEYNIYEEFDIGVHSYLHPDSLKDLYQNGLISLEKLHKSSFLRDNVLILHDTDEWAINSFKTSKKWKEILIICDELKNMR